jgi:SAM-dependent methyltransferase
MVTSLTVQQSKSWKPDRPTSKGATAFHDAVINASWNHECLDELISIAEPHIHKNDVVVDFGCGTGTSSIRILEKLKINIRLWLVDNSPAWLGKAYEFLSSRKNVDFFLLEKKDKRYATLSETVGKGVVDNVISANTVHLIPNLKETFKGIADALKRKGTFVFNTGNITRKGRKKGILMLDSTVYRVHDIAIGIIRKNPKFKKYRKNLDRLIETYNPLRKFIFPDPRPIQDYLKSLKAAGFKYMKPVYKCFRLKYDDWINFLRIKRLQAGILPEVGGKYPSPEEEKDRDTLIIMSAKKLFDELERLNPFADDKSYLGEWTYIFAVKAES